MRRRYVPSGRRRTWPPNLPRTASLRQSCKSLSRRLLAEKRQVRRQSILDIGSSGLARARTGFRRFFSVAPYTSSLEPWLAPACTTKTHYPWNPHDYRAPRGRCGERGSTALRCETGNPSERESERAREAVLRFDAKREPAAVISEAHSLNKIFRFTRRGKRPAICQI